MEFLYTAFFFLDFWLALGDWNKIDNATLTQVMHPSNEMFNLHNSVTVQFNNHRTNADYRFYYQNSNAVGIRNYRGNHPMYAVCEWTNETEVWLNTKTFIDSPPFTDAANFVCSYNLVVNDDIACKQR